MEANDDNPYLGPMTHHARQRAGRTSEPWEARLKRLGRDLEAELPEERLEFVVKGSVVRVPNPDGGALFGAMIRVEAIRAGQIIKSNLVPLETADHGLYLSDSEADVQRVLERRIATIKESLT